MASAFVGRLSALLASAVLAAPIAAQPPTGEGTPRSEIAASATGEVKATPDRATILFSVETRAATAAEASAQNAEQQQAVLRALRAAGLAEGDVGTVSYTISPNMEYDQTRGASRVVGYIARNTVRAEVRELARVGRVIDAAIQAGANEVSSLQFSTSRAEQLRLDAIRSAMAQACREASALATAAGGSLGPLTFASTSESAPYPPPVPMMRMEAARAADTPITPQDVTVGVNVSTRWLFVPAGVAVPAGAPTCR
ncbi:MAG TPA: SIMPL domain-containing protein [Gemmatimonadaceae bacterium]|nr:SIMPL domain-containing protein [Gemmatimonadaceae bacterium]